jgi:hypothetical protein
MDKRSLVELQAELAGNEEQALSEYFAGRTKSSIQALEALLQSYGAAHCNSEMTKELDSAIRYDELLAHGRLARQYRREGREAKAAAHVEEGVKLGRALFHKDSWTASDLTTLVDDVDKKIRAGE